MTQKSFSILVFLGFVLMSASNGVGESQNKDRSGSPDGDNVCSQCHSSSAFSTEVSLTIEDEMGDEITEYQPGETYFLTYQAIAGNGSPTGFGFQSSVLFSDNSNAGDFVNPGIQVQLETINNTNLTGRKVVEHSSPASSGTWQVEWEAPLNINGDVTFYFSSVAINGNGMSSGDTYGGGTLTISVDPSLGINEESESEMLVLNNETSIIVSSSAAEFSGNYTLYSISGKKLSSSHFNNSIQLTKSDIPVGVSLLSVDTKKKTMVKKIWNF